MGVPLPVKGSQRHAGSRTGIAEQGYWLAEATLKVFDVNNGTRRAELVGRVVVSGICHVTV